MARVHPERGGVEALPVALAQAAHAGTRSSAVECPAAESSPCKDRRPSRSNVHTQLAI
jgi:hypothetical protein